MKSLRHTTLFLALAGVIFFQCSGSKKENDEQAVTSENATEHEAEADVTKTEAGKPEFTVDQIFQKQVSELFNAYLSLKDAFVASDASKVKDEARHATEALSKVDMKLVTDKAHTDWMTYQGSASAALGKIQESADIEKQREEFSNLSDAVYKMIKAYGLGGTTAYYEFCPMALNDKGAHWLSMEEKIKNPYFGDKMLSCGSVEETLQ